MLVAALVSVLAVACGGDDDDDAGDAPTATTSEVGDAQNDEAGEATATTEEGEATATEDAPAPTTAATTAEEDEAGLDTSMLVIPEARDASIEVNGRVLGNPDAAVSIIEYGDFQ